MRIGQITYSYKPIVGGGDVYVEMLFRLLEREGHCQRVYQRIAPEEEESLRFVPNPLARLGRAQFWTQAPFLFLLREELRREDLIIAHYPVYLLAAAMLRKAARPALLGISHGVTWDDRPGSIPARLKRAVARGAFRRADGFVANDTFFLREMGLQVPPRQGLFTEVSKGRWFIPNCVSPGFQRGAPIEDLSSLRPLLLPRNLYRNRGIHLAVEAFRIFAPHHPETHLVVLGEESQPGYAAAVKERVKQLRLQERVIFRGHFPHEKMADAYASAEMCLIPSLCGEGTSLAALEAMACGVAVVSTDVAGLKDLPTVQSPPEAEALAQALLKVYPERKRIGEEQKARVSRDYSYERWSQAWLEVIRRVEINLRQERR